MSSLLVLAAALCVPIWLVWRFIQHNVNHSLWNLAGPPPSSLITGNLRDVYSGNAWDFHKGVLEKYGGVFKIQGLFGDISLSVSDPKALQHIILKDQYNYEPALSFIRGTRLIFGPGLLGSLGDEHRKQRKILNPVFSTAHMRDMIPTFYKVSHKLEDSFAKRVVNGPQEIDIYSWLSRTALELVAQSGLGYSFDELDTEGGQHPYSIAAKNLVSTMSKTIPAQLFLGPLTKFGSPKFWRFVVNIVPWKALHDLRDIVDVMWDTSVSIYESKKQALHRGDEVFKDQIQEGKDIISILMRANLSASVEDRLTEEEVIGQMGTLTFAAMDTTTSALSRLLGLLSQRHDIQEKLRQELNTATNGGENELGYDDLVSLPYLDAVCRESLRLYPPILLQRRVARQDIILPILKPLRGVDGKPIQEILIPKGTLIMINILNCNRDPEIWGPDSFEFKPERWLDPSSGLGDFSAHSRHLFKSDDVPWWWTSLHRLQILSTRNEPGLLRWRFSEVVLSLFIQKFKFTFPDGKDIVWKTNGITKPVVVGEDGPRLPLIVELAK